MDESAHLQETAIEPSHGYCPHGSTPGTLAALLSLLPYKVIVTLAQKTKYHQRVWSRE